MVYPTPAKGIEGFGQIMEEECQQNLTNTQVAGTLYRRSLGPTYI